MPTYEYMCSDCGYRFEEIQRMSEAPLKVCPECSKESLRRLIGTGAGFIFKGKGFYITDYKNNGNDEATTKKATETKKVEQNKTEAKDTKPAAEKS